MPPTASSSPSTRFETTAKRLTCTLVIGLVAGLAGLALATLLHLVQHAAFAYSGHGSHGLETFLEGAAAVSPLRRFCALLACGFVAGFGWWALDRYLPRRVGIAKALQSDPPRMPIATTVIHALLQIVTVGLGSPLGREVAPREVGATFAGWCVTRIGLDRESSRTLVACGAGAGLAAVYNVPWAGAAFTLEVLLRTRSWKAIGPALVTSFIAARVAGLGLGDITQYVVPPVQVDGSLLVWSICAGPLFGIVAQAFRRYGEAARRREAIADWRAIARCVIVFALIGGLAGPLPAILGNGKGPAQLAFDGSIATGVAALVLVAKVLVVMAALRVGAHGGLLTPGLSCGALLGVLLGAAWTTWWPGPSVGAYALVGATAFLATSMAMPLTAILLTFEFTGIGVGFAVPIVLAVAGSIAAARVCAKAATWFVARRSVA